MNTPHINTTGMSAAQKAWATRKAQGWTPKSKRTETAVRAPQTDAVTVSKPQAEPDWMKPQVADLASRDAVEPATELEAIDLYVDRKEIGCGLRRFVVLGKGSHKVQLFCTSPMATILVDRREVDEKAMPARKFKPQVVACFIREKIARADRINDEAQSKTAADDGGVFAVRALELLDGAKR